MDQKIVNSITKTIIRRFPEVAGKRPKVQRHNTPIPKNTNVTPTFVLIYQGTGSNPSGKALPRRVRVVADAKGKIIKITTSR